MHDGVWLLFFSSEIMILAEDDSMIKKSPLNG